jgi:hypothetical protein
MGEVHDDARAVLAAAAAKLPIQWMPSGFMATPEQ